MTTFTAACGLALALAGCPVFAQNYQPAQERKFVVELQSIVYVQLVKDSGLVGKPTSPAASTAEQALTLLIAALMEPSYDKWLAMHDAAAVRGIESRNRENNRGREQWEKLWKEGMGGRTVTLLAKVEYVRTGNRYILFRYEVSPPPVPQAVAANLRMGFKDMVVVKQQGPQWVVSHDLAEDRVLMHIDDIINSQSPIIKTQRMLN